MTRNVSLRLDDELAEQVQAVADATDRDPSYVMRKAIEGFVEHEGWIIRETRRRWDEIKKGDAILMNHEEVETRFQFHSSRKKY